MTTKINAKIYQGTPRNLAMLARKLQQGDLVAVPSETVYGLAAHALDPQACRKIFQAKKRPTTDPLIVHLHSLKQLETIAQVTPTALTLAKAFWPGPLTLVLKKQNHVPGIVTAGLDSVAVRIPRHPLFLKLLQIADIPLAAPSANPFGYISPTTAEHVRSGLGTKINYILDGGPASVGLESTIIDIRDTKNMRILRPGGITNPQIEKILGITLKARKSVSPAHGAQIAPGMLSQHYSPRTKVILHDQLAAPTDTDITDEARVYFAKPPDGKLTKHCFWLDRLGDQKRAARNLFALLQKLDGLHYRIIHVEKAPTGTYSAAINDRLQRASAKN